MIEDVSYMQLFSVILLGGASPKTIDFYINVITLPFLAYVSLVSPSCFVLSKEDFSDWIL